MVSLLANCNAWREPETVWVSGRMRNTTKVNDPAVSQDVQLDCATCGGS